MKKNFIFLILLFMLFPTQIFADVVVTPNKEQVELNDILTVDVDLTKLDNGFSSGDLILTFDDSFLEYIDLEVSQSIDKANEITIIPGMGTLTINYKKETSNITNGDFLTLTFRVINTAEEDRTTWINLETASLKDNDQTDISFDTVSTKIVVLGREIGYLTSLSVDNFELNPVFDQTVYGYDLGSTQGSEIVINAEVMEGYEIIGTGLKVLEFGVNMFTIEVKNSENVIENTYSVKIYREEISTEHLKLITLEIEGYEITFDPDTYEYTIDVEEDLKELTVIATAQEGLTIQGATTYTITDKITEINVIVSNELQDLTYVVKLNRIKDTDVDVDTSTTPPIETKPEETKESSNSLIYIIIAILFIISIVVIVIIKKKKQIIGIKENNELKEEIAIQLDNREEIEEVNLEESQSDTENKE